MAANIINLLKHYTLKLKAFLFSRNVLSFLFFLLFSFLFWYANSHTKGQPADVRSSVAVTEKKIQLPVTIINNPDSIKIKTFPATVKVTFSVKTGKAKNVDYSDVKVLFDYSTVVKGSANHKLSVSYSNDYISDISISPQVVEYIIEY